MLLLVLLPLLLVGGFQEAAARVMSKQDNVTASQRKLSSHDEGDSGIAREREMRDEAAGCVAS